MSDERNYGIDLLRLVLMYMVCMLHILGQGGVLKASGGNTLQLGIFGFLETFSYCAVDSFALISGYTASGRPRKWSRLADMWFQVFFYSFILTVVLGLAHFRGHLEFRSLLSGFLPVTYGYFWYFTAYFALFFAMPLLNPFLFSLDKDRAGKALLILFAMFSLTAIVSDPFKTDYGYSAIWLIVLYCTGVLAKKTGLFSERKTPVLVAMLLASTLFAWGMMMFFKDARWITYTSPAILLNALLLIVLFSRIRLRGTLIRRLAPLAFGIYLFHTNKVIWENILCDRLTFLEGKPLPLSLCIVILSAALLFATGLAVEFLRSLAAKALKIHVLSEKITGLVSAILQKALCLLK